jgi:Zn-dependent protease
MRRLRIPAGSLFGIRLWLHLSWFPILGAATWVLTGAFAQAFPGMASPERIAMAVVTGIGFFGCLTAHEVAHSLSARRLGIAVSGITLFLFGGVSEIAGEPASPAAEFAIALAGPVTSVALGSVAGLLSDGSHALGWSGAEGVLGALTVANLGLAVFNMIPGLPLDGGRILRAAVWHRSDDRAKATRVAAIGGRVLAVLLAGSGIALAITGTREGLWYVAMGGFVWFLASSAARAEAPEPALAFPRQEEGVTA